MAMIKLEVVSPIDGKVIATGTPDEIRSNQEVRAVYLGHDH